MALCNVTGTVYLLNGELAQSRVVIFERDTKRIRAEYLGATIPQPVITKTDRQGLIDVDLVTGVYQIKALGPYGGYIGNCVVPDDASARLEDIIDVADLPEAPPVWLSQVTDARDRAESASDDAVAAADIAVTAAGSVQFPVSYGVEQSLNNIQVKRALANIGIGWLRGGGSYIEPYPGGNLDDLSNSLPWGWFFYQAANMTGGPGGVGWGHVLRSQRAVGGGVAQLMIAETPSSMQGFVFTRVRIGQESWSPWRRLAFADELPGSSLAGMTDSSV